MKFTRIKGGFSEHRRLPHLGKIRLGIKKRSTHSEYDYPVETQYFVCPPEVMKVYGEAPLELDIMFPLNDPEECFPQRLAWYGKTSGLKCHGDNVEASRYDGEKKEWIKRECPCEHLKSDKKPKGECTAQAHLMVFLPKIPKTGLNGVYQITTGSFHSTVRLNSQIDLLRGMTGGRLAMIPMKLRRVPQQMTHNGTARTHYTLDLAWDFTLEQLIQIRSAPITELLQIEAPVETNPKLDPVDIEDDLEPPHDNGGDRTTVEAEALANMDEKELEETNRQLEARRQGPQPPKKQESSPGPLVVKEIPDAHWHKIITEIRDNHEWRYHLQVWQSKHDVSDVERLTAGGQQKLLHHLRESIETSFPH